MCIRDSLTVGTVEDVVPMRDQPAEVFKLIPGILVVKFIAVSPYIKEFGFAVCLREEFFPKGEKRIKMQMIDSGMEAIEIVLKVKTAGFGGEMCIRGRCGGRAWTRIRPRMLSTGRARNGTAPTVPKARIPIPGSPLRRRTAPASHLSLIPERAYRFPPSYLAAAAPRPLPWCCLLYTSGRGKSLQPLRPDAPGRAS